MNIPETHIALWLIIPVIFFIVGIVAFIVATLNRKWRGIYIPSHSFTFVVSCWVGIISFLIGLALIAGHYLTKLEIIVR